MATAPVGNATPATTDRSIFPGTGLICHLTAGDTSLKPDAPAPCTPVKYVGRSTRTSRHGAMPNRHRLLVPSMRWPPSCALKLTPFSFCRLPMGTTMLELVTSGRSVAISSDASGQLSAWASVNVSVTNATKRQLRTSKLSTGHVTTLESTPTGARGPGRQDPRDNPWIDSSVTSFIPNGVWTCQKHAV